MQIFFVFFNINLPLGVIVTLVNKLVGILHHKIKSLIVEHILVIEHNF